MSDIFWTKLKTSAFPADESTVVMLPIGSTEQHGPHLPVGVDSQLATEVATRAARIVVISQPVLVLPTLWVSLAEHHMNFGGTLTLDFSTFRAVIRCVMSSLARHGFRRILLLNGHGGNVASLSVIVDELSREFAIPLAAMTYWEAASAEFASLLEGQPNLRHACEAETSMMLSIAPDLVDIEAARRVEAPADGLAPVGGVVRSRRMEEWSASGVVGMPSLANTEKGTLLLDAAAAAVASRILDGSIWPVSDRAKPAETRRAAPYGQH